MYETIQSRAIIGTFARELEVAQGPAWVDQASWLNGDSDQAEETYGWLGLPPVMREWIGERSAKQLVEEGMIIRNRDYEATLEFHRRDMRREKFGLIQKRIAGLAERAKAHWAQLLTPLLINGDTSASTYGVRSTYDGVNFFGATHRGSQNNVVGISGVSSNRPTVAQAQEGLLQAVERLASFQDEHDEPINETMQSLVVICPPSILGAVAAAISNATIQGTGSGVDNVLTNLGKTWSVADNARLASVTGWGTGTGRALVVCRTDSTMKALIRQEEEGVQIGSTATGSEEEFKVNRHLYGISASRGVGYGLWEHAIKVTFAA